MQMNQKQKAASLKANRLHVGHLIKEVFNESGLSVTEFARLINCARPNVYSIFERYDISVEQLLDISDVLKHNFFEDILSHSGISVPQYPKQLHIVINLEELTARRSERISVLLKELVELCDDGNDANVTQAMGGCQ